ncbi:MAG: 6-bladed beta-propeller [bacterium]|nr:6-bladed beta-propeller [bacterium]
MRRVILPLVILITFVSTLSGGAVEIADNPATSVNAPETIRLVELWRLGGDEEDEIIGHIYDLDVDDDNRTYILDSQMKDVIVVDGTGEIVHRIGRVGEGPAEYERPVDLFLTGQGTVGIIQSYPAKIVQWSLDGIPREGFPLPEIWPGRWRAILRNGEYAADHLYLRAARRDRSDPHFTRVQDALFRWDGEADTMIKIHERDRKRDVDDAAHREWERTYSISPFDWTVGPNGTTFVCATYDRYEIQVISPSGDPVRVIHREYEPRQRERSYRDNLQRAYDEAMVGRTYRRQPISFATAETDMSIQEMFARDDGTLWVLSSRGACDVEPGEIATFDVFDTRGRFDRRVTLLGDGCYYTDRFYLSGELFHVIRNIDTDYREWRAGDDETDGIYEIICYRLP